MVELKRTVIAPVPTDLACAASPEHESLLNSPPPLLHRRHSAFAAAIAPIRPPDKDRLAMFRADLPNPVGAFCPLLFLLPASPDGLGFQAEPFEPIANRGVANVERAGGFPDRGARFDQLPQPGRINLAVGRMHGLDHRNQPVLLQV